MMGVIVVILGWIVITRPEATEVKYNLTKWRVRK